MSASASAEFFRQLATFLEAGVSIVKALEGLAKQGPRQSRNLASKLILYIESGSTLSEAAARHPGVFPPSQIALLQAGEQSGRLPDTLLRMAQAIERQGRFARQMFISLLYPILVYHAGVVVVTCIRALLDFSEGGLQVAFRPLAGLPVLLIGFGPVYGLLFAFWCFGKVSQRNHAVGLLRDRFISFIPVIGAIARFSAVARFARVLEALYQAGIGVPRGLQLASDACGNEILRPAMQRSADAVADGEEPITALTASGALPPDVIAMLATGFESGHLDEMLIKAAESYEERAANRAKVLSVMAPLLLMLIIGVILIYFIITIFSGYLNILNELLEAQA